MVIHVLIIQIVHLINQNKLAKIIKEVLMDHVIGTIIFVLKEFVMIN